MVPGVQEEDREEEEGGGEEAEEEVGEEEEVEGGGGLKTCQGTGTMEESASWSTRTTSPFITSMARLGTMHAPWEGGGEKV